MLKFATMLHSRICLEAGAKECIHTQIQKATPVTVDLTRSLVIYWAAQIHIQSDDVKGRHGKVRPVTCMSERLYALAHTGSRRNAAD